MAEEPAASNHLIRSSTGVGSTNYWEAVAESCVRVTMAGFAGSLVGLANERQQQSVEVPVEEVQSEASQRRHGVRSRPRRPPRLPIKSASTNLPLTWSVSCMLFAVVLESCRRASPTDILWELASENEASSDNYSETEKFNEHVKRRALTSIVDYTLGGTAAGLAGALGQRRRILRNRSATRFGLVTGFGLGLLAGTLQAAIDVGNLYLERERQAEQEKALENKLGKEDQS